MYIPMDYHKKDKGKDTSITLLPETQDRIDRYVDSHPQADIMPYIDKQVDELVNDILNQAEKAEGH
jgi:hypothetical protein